MSCEAACLIVESSTRVTYRSLKRVMSRVKIVFPLSVYHDPRTHGLER